jgi:hypothetical protein
MTNEKRQLEYGKWKLPQKLRLAVCLVKKFPSDPEYIPNRGGIILDSAAHSAIHARL